MESTITNYRTVQGTEQTSFNLLNSDVQEATAHHGSYTVARFLWTYVVIFTAIMLVVIIAERFFFVS